MATRGAQLSFLTIYMLSSLQELSFGVSYIPVFLDTKILSKYLKLRRWPPGGTLTQFEHSYSVFGCIGDWFEFYQGPFLCPHLLTARQHDAMFHQELIQHLEGNALLDLHDYIEHTVLTPGPPVVVSAYLVGSA